MNYLIQFGDDENKTEIVARVTEPLLRNKSWFWFKNHGDQMTLYNQPWREVYSLTATPGRAPE